ncbi:MAG: hypothetical protein H0T68_14685 [Gemmatimonadales bacterium]|nr:hypothetical protein [Gemmatimonadales bacterium]
MATVYLADDLRHGRQIALKVLHPELAATIGPMRFLQEIRLTARLQHPHILPMLDFGEAAGHCDPEFRPAVAEARRRLAALAGEPST